MNPNSEPKEVYVLLKELTGTMSVAPPPLNDMMVRWDTRICKWCHGEMKWETSYATH